MKLFQFLQKTTETQSNENLFEKQIIEKNEADHNYLASENETNTNYIYVVDPQITSNIKVDSIQSSNVYDGDGKSTTILVCNPNFRNMTIMDVGAIQTVDQDAQSIIS